MPLVDNSNVVLKRESFNGILEETYPLFAEHYAETALDQEQVPFILHRKFYKDCEENGSLYFLVAREFGQIVAYYVAFISEGIHSEPCITCVTDSFRVLPEHRGRGLARLLFATVKKELEEFGVRKWVLSGKIHKESAFLFEELGAKPSEIVYNLILGK